MPRKALVRSEFESTQTQHKMQTVFGGLRPARPETRLLCRCHSDTVVQKFLRVMNRVRAGRIFFPDPVPENIMFPLGNLFSPNFGIFKVQGGCPMEKYSATLGLQPKKSVEFLGAEFVGDLQRDKQDLGHWNFIQRCLPPWSQN